MDDNSSDSVNKEANLDPISGQPGAHPVGVAIGASAGGIAAGAAAGTLAAGPIGAAIGAAIGAVAGGLGGKAVAEHFDPTHLDHWRVNHAKQPFYTAGKEFDAYEPAYRLGSQERGLYANKSFDDVERIWPATTRRCVASRTSTGRKPGTRHAPRGTASPTATDVRVAREKAPPSGLFLDRGATGRRAPRRIAGGAAALLTSASPSCRLLPMPIHRPTLLQPLCAVACLVACIAVTLGNPAWAARTFPQNSRQVRISQVADDAIVATGRPCTWPRASSCSRRATRPSCAAPCTPTSSRASRST